MLSWVYCLLITVSIQMHGTDQTIQISPDMVTVRENQDANFSCVYTNYSECDVSQTMWYKLTRAMKFKLVAFAFYSNCALNLIENTSFITSCKSKYLFNLTWRKVTRADHATDLKCSTRINGTEVFSTNTALVNVFVPVETITISASNKTKIDVNENNTIILQCLTSPSFPAPYITCFVQKDINDANPNYIGTTNHSMGQEDNHTFTRSFLQYRPSRLHNNYSILCKASNSLEVAAVESNGLQLNVKYPPNGPPELDIDATDNKYKVVEDHNVNLSCTSYGGNPRANLNWTCEQQFKKTVNVSTDSEKTKAIIIWKVSRQSNTACFCSSTHPLANTSRTKDVEVTVLYPPKVPTLQLQYKGDKNNISADAKLIEHESYHLSCSAVGNPPPSIYFWIGPGDMNVSKERLFDLANVKRKQNGTYSCHVQNIMRPSYGGIYTGENNISVEVDILYPPFIGKLPDKTITEGSLLNLSCPFVQGNPAKTNFIWTRDGDSQHWNDQYLSIWNVSRNDQMTYTCTVENLMTPSLQPQEKGTDTETINLNVEYEATVVKFFVNGFAEQQNVTLNESNYINFTCYVSGNPISTTDINFNDKKLLERTLSNHLQFLFGPTSCLDAGTYICRGYNKHNGEINSTKMVHVFVNCRPRRNPLTPWDQNITIAKNSRIRINFTAIAYPKPAYVAWQKYNGSSWTSLVMNENIRLFQLDLVFSITVLNVSEEDFGQYRLVINNTFGSHEEQFSIIAEDKPNLPTGFSVIEESVTESSITMYWNPSFNGGLPQTFVLRYSKIDENWLNASIEDNGLTTMNYTLTRLSSGTLYQLMINAENRLGKSPHSDALYVKTKEFAEESAAITGLVIGCLGSVLVIAIAFVLIFFRCRRYQKKKNTCNERTSNARLNNEISEMKAIHDRTLIEGMGNTYEKLKPDQERGSPEKTEKEYEELKAGKDGFASSNPIYTNLTL